MKRIFYFLLILTTIGCQSQTKELEKQLEGSWVHIDTGMYIDETKILITNFVFNENHKGKRTDNSTSYFPDLPTSHLIVESTYEWHIEFYNSKPQIILTKEKSHIVHFTYEAVRDYTDSLLNTYKNVDAISFRFDKFNNLELFHDNEYKPFTKKNVGTPL